MTLEDFNNLTNQEQGVQLKNCCGSATWVTAVMHSLPYAHEADLLERAQTIWFKECKEPDWREAFAHHPRIGDKHNTSDKVKDSVHLAVGEQAGVGENDTSLLHKLKAANEAYEAKFGFTFIVCASGKSGAEMLDLLEDRLHNDIDEEMRIAMAEQWKITLLRLKRLLDEATFAAGRSQVTTHILDTSLGKPARNVAVSLFRFADEKWQRMATGRTNEDGRVADLLPVGFALEKNKYKLAFETTGYFMASGVTTFYPEVEIIFNIVDDSHYHVPLLLNPFGYSTYRGS